MTRHLHDRSVRHRDDALRRLRRAKLALTTLSLLFAGMVATAAARTFPGHKSRAPTVTTTTRPETGTAPTTSAGTGPANHARRRVDPRRAAARSTTTPRRAHVHRAAAAPSPSTAAATSPAPAAPTVAVAPPATTPAPAPATAPAVTSGGS